ncbi:heparinase II/III family protein [Kocuria sp. CPCC 204721]|uniref:heparinase II/III domain-containing protein n=1 Tax=Kocuria sp. CPCC 204721 TaxID=3073548 RepID=UPI0034D7952A
MSTPLNLATADRQAFGSSFDRPSDPRAHSKAVLDGVLSLPPHHPWEGNVLNWTADPHGDRNWQFQHHTLRWINPLRWAALDGDAGAREGWVRVVRSWCEQNIPAPQSGSAFAWKDMADGNRAIQLSIGARLVGDEDLGWFCEALRYHRDWLMDEAHIVGKNHGLHQHAGLLVVSAMLGDDSGMATAVSRMERQFASTFDEQGGNDEGSTAYHQLNLMWWGQAWDRVAREGLEVPGWVAQRLDAAGTVLAHLAQPDGRLPQIGDSARGPVSRGLHPESDFAATAGRTGRRPRATTLVLDRGYVLTRSGWGENRPLSMESHMVLRHGEDMRGHSHDDRGSLQIYAGGRPWLVDSGFHSYQQKDPVCSYLHSRQAHNVASLAGMRRDTSAPVELARCELTPESHEIELADCGYGEQGVRRRVLYLTGPDCWIVWDHTAPSVRVPLEQAWHVDHGVAVTRHDRGYELRDGTRSLTMSWLGTLPQLRLHRATDGDLRGWVGTRWKTLLPGSRITAQAVPPSHRNVVLIAPSGERPLGIARSYITTAGVLDVILTRGTATWQVRIAPDVLRVKQLPPTG